MLTATPNVEESMMSPRSASSDRVPRHEEGVAVSLAFLFGGHLDGDVHDSCRFFDALACLII